MPNNSLVTSFIFLMSMTTYSFLLHGCGASGAAREWVSITTNGDKPGIGILLLVEDGQVKTGSFYILDPNSPNALSAGKRYDLVNVKQEGRVISCRVEVEDGSAPTGKREIEMTISIHSTFQADQVEAMVKTDGRGLANTIFKLHVKKRTGI